MMKEGVCILDAALVGYVKSKVLLNFKTLCYLNTEGVDLHTSSKSVDE